ncbi:MAG: thermonuclease family protein [Desulfosalsimonas sp.]
MSRSSSRDRDRYGRTVALVYIEGDGECLNEELVRAGFAYVYDRYCRIRDCYAWKDLESNVRESEIGLWKQASPIPPWKWRHSK